MRKLVNLQDWSPYTGTERPMRNFMLETNDEGVFLNPSGERKHLIDRDGNVTYAASGVCAKVMKEAWEAWEEQRRKYPHKSDEALFPGWSYVVERDGRSYAKSSGNTKVYLERAVSKHRGDELRLRIDNKSASDSKSAPLEVILRFLAKEAQRSLKVVPQ